MNSTYLNDVATYQIETWWKKLLKKFPSAGDVPSFTINNRLKTTAGRAFYLSGEIDLSAELFWEYTEEFCKDTIPHELSHIVAWRIFEDPGHGKGWKTVMRSIGLNPTRLHEMVNTKHATRKARVL